MTSDDRGRRFQRAHRALTTAAVTGTNGKSTTTSMLAAIVRAAGEPDALLTTLGASVCGRPIAPSDPTDEFLETLETAVRRRVRVLALEVTSKALAGGFAQRWPPEVAVFTNLSHDHLDMHASPEAYLAAKAQLFRCVRPGGVAVLNGDDPVTALLREVLPPGIEERTFSVRREDASLAATAVRVSAHGTEVELAPSRLGEALGGRLALRVVGDVHAQNALAAALAADALALPAETIRTGLAGFEGVPGRFQIAGRRPLVVVDYAHTPDGLVGTLRTARPLVGRGGALVCVFGCGGNRDRGKRALMGAAAHAHADEVILTNDNPRREAPEAIAAEVLDGAVGPGARWRTELDRRRAIEAAIGSARAADVIIIAGKGHEAEQEIGDQVLPFSDLEVARAAWRQRHDTDDTGT